MVTTARRTCLYCGDKPPFDNWVKLTTIPGYSGTGAWIHETCIEPMRAIFERMTPKGAIASEPNPHHKESERT